MESQETNNYEEWLKTQPITLRLEDRTYYKYVNRLNNKEVNKI